MNKIEINDKWMQKTGVVWLGAMLCCLLWGSAFPCIKIGYGMWNIESVDTSSQILFAGMRFVLAGIDIWKSAGRKIHQAGEGLRRQDSVACDAADSHTIPVLLYRSRTYKRSQGVHHRGSKCIRCHHSVRLHIPSGKCHCKEDAWLSGWICGSCTYKHEWNEFPYSE